MAATKNLTSIIYKMMRLRTALLLALFVAIADAATKNQVSKYSPLLVLVLTILTAWYVFGTSINDLADEQIDKINLQGNSGRPLINQETNRRTLWLLAAGSALVALGLSMIISRQALLLTTGALVLSYIYSMPPIKISYRGIIAPLLLPLAYVAYPFMITAEANHAVIGHSDNLLLAGLYVSFIARIILKDFRDVKGDAKFGKKTFVVRHGATATCIVSAIMWIIGAFIICIRFMHWPVLIVALIPYTVAILYVLKWLSQEAKLKRQVQLVGLVGRLGNGSALLILTAAYFEIEPARELLYTSLLVGMAIFGLSTAYSLYEPLITTRSKSSNKVSDRNH